MMERSESRLPKANSSPLRESMNTVLPVSEKQWQETIIDLARRFQYEFIYHTWNSRHSPAGFPDLIIIEDGVMIVAELKREDGELSPEQYFWLLEFTSVTDYVYLWKPSDWEEVKEVLGMK